MPIFAELIHALPPEERRVFNRDEAASYVGVSPRHFAKLVLEGTMPPSLPYRSRTRRWDKAALDRALDKIAGGPGSSSNTESAYDIWKKANGQG